MIHAHLCDALSVFNCAQYFFSAGVLGDHCLQNPDCYDAVSNTVCDDAGKVCVCASGYSTTSQTVCVARKYNIAIRNIARPVTNNKKNILIYEF